MGLHQQIAVPSMPAVARVLAGFEREQLAAFVEVAIGLIDLADGDPDLELNGDEQDHNNAEDDFREHAAGAFPTPGCPVADPDLAADDMPCDDLDDDREPEEPLMPRYGVDQANGPFKVDHSLDRRLMRPYRDRARAQACDRVDIGPWSRYDLPGDAIAVGVAADLV